MKPKKFIFVVVNTLLTLRSATVPIVNYNSTVDVDLEGDVYADDSIFGKAICNHIRKGKTNVIVQPK